ncbi:hypothetical protein CMUS01_14316 [Colletotrichum musicola]|uniref:Uncharacterized protein n=1 Tax=Colletotrichum musicola TaxID=2175873 RepID=A0A8H6J5Y7_9PEZI|nr:hypothetical protein CMUS01_14316 [Colletotrichum musicola]
MADQSESQSSNAGQKDGNASAQTVNKDALRDEYMRQMQKGIDDMIAKDPELASNLATSPSTYAPGMDFVAACQEYLDPAGRERFTAAMGRYMGMVEPAPGTEESDIFDEVRKECLALLEGRADLQAKWDEVFGDREAWRKIYDAVRQRKNE